MDGAFSRETTIRRDAEGRWFHDGVPIDKPAIERAFDRWIDRAPDGRYILKNSVNWAYVEIEGAPLFVLALEGEEISLSDGSVETLDPATLRQDERGVLYCDARTGTMVAQFSRSAQASLAPLVSEDELGVYVAIGAVRARPPVVRDPLAAFK